MTPIDVARGFPSRGQAARRLGLLGGTFDPVHFGHLDAADAARRALSLEEVLFVPAHDPPHRPIEPIASVFHRFALVALAIEGQRGFRLSDMELTRQGSSYTADTLRMLHGEGWTPSQIFFILGTDAFAEISTWREYPAVLDGANFAVIARPGTSIDAAAARTPELRARVRRATSVPETPSRTGIYLVDARTRDASSTTIRQRLAADRAIDDLVPSPVARHIAAHHLYGAGRSLHG